MTYMHNRRGSVLLMAIGMLTILAILSSTFVIISNLDSEETESLAVRAYAEPITEGLLARAIAQIGYDRAVSDLTGPYGDMPTGPEGWLRFIDCPHGAYSDTTKFPRPEFADAWLASSYTVGARPGIGGHFTNIDANTNKDDYNFPEAQFVENGAYVDGQDGKHIDTDCDGIPDATLYDSQISSPLADANTYWAAMRIVDLASRICVNTAGGWYASDAPDARPNGSGPAMINLRGFLDDRGSMGASIPLYGMFHEGTSAGGAPIKGRIGDNSNSLKGYDKYCGRYLLGPARRGYQAYGIGDEAFFLNACSYKDNISMFGGRLNEMLAPISVTNVALPDQIRRQLTTMSSVSAVVRDPSAGFTELLTIDAVQSAADCQLVYERMRIMLEQTGIGNNQADWNRMAAHFSANLWAYCANTVAAGSMGVGVGEPWKFQPAGADFSVFGLRQDMVITQVFARHIPNSVYDANDLDKDDSAWGYAVEIANPTSNVLNPGQYELELKSQDGNTSVVNLAGGIPPVFAGPRVNATTAPKRVYYNCGFGATRPDKTPAGLFGEAVSMQQWVKKDGLDFRQGSASMKITLYRLVAGERVPIDSVTVAEATGDLKYNTSIQSRDLTGDDNTKPTATETCIHIRRDDRLKSGVTRLARFNMAAYAVETKSTQTLLGKDNNVGDGGLTVCTYATPDNVDEYSPGIYRPRDAPTVSPTARESMPTDDYFLPSLADLCNIYLTGPIREAATDKAFTTEILQTARSKVFWDRPDRGRMPTVNPVQPMTNLTDMVDRAPSPLYPDVPPGYLFHEFFTRNPSHQARANEKRRVYGLVNINTLGLSSQGANLNSAAWWLPWPTDSPSGSLASNIGNRLALGGNARAYDRATAISYIQQYRDLDGDCGDRAGWAGVGGLRSAAGSDIAGFLTPGEVAIPLAKYMESILGNDAATLQDADYARARNCLFGYISDSITTRSDVYACYITVQHGEVANGKRWRYVAVIDRSNVVRTTDKPALLMLTPLR